MITAEHLEWIAEDPKGYLSRNYKIEMRIKAKYDRIEHLYNVCNATTQELKPVVVYTGPSNKIERCIADVVDLESEIRQEIVKLKQIQRETAEAINTLLDDEVLITLMESRWLSGKRLEEITVEMNYAFRHIQRLHARALRQMQKNAIIPRE